MNDVIMVRPVLRVVANGRSVRDGQQWLRLTLVATPELVDHPARGPGFPFKEWPSAMAALVRNGGLGPSASPTGMKVAFRTITPAPVPAAIGADTDWQFATMTPTRSDAYASDTKWSSVNRIWGKLLSPEGIELWEDLANDIVRSMRGKNRGIEIGATYSGKRDPELDVDGAIVTVPATSQERTVVRAVVPIRQSDLAIGQEGERAGRVLAKVLSGPLVLPDEAEGTVEADFEKRWKGAIDATDAERIISSEINTRLEKLLETGELPARSPGVAAAGAEQPVPTGISLTEGRDRNRPGARERYHGSHQYGTWLQRSFKSQYRQARPTENRTAPIPLLDRARERYFAVQGDPTLARLFGLVLDFEVPADQLPGVGTKLHLAIAKDPGSTLAQVVTAAKVTDGGFWPLSAFEALVVQTPTGVKILNEPNLADQQDGLIKLGANVSLSCDGDVPRFELTSLDLRRAVDAKTASRDRGEQHKTGGFSILDRGRADQIVSDLVLAAYQTKQVTDPSKVVILHAEELTVGRCMDVAAAPGGSKLTDAKWRALGRRLVDFEFGSDDAVAESLLRQLLALSDREAVADEVSFQTVARMMPVIGAAGEGSSVEVIPEEAIYLWDGTPAGALTEAGDAGRSAIGVVTFDSTITLPTRGERPCPLRFGVPYMFRCRPRYLGGGVPAAQDEAVNKVTADHHVLPAAAGGKARPRRFLRHEGIAAPLMLLPRHIATYRLGHMGYEQLDAAIVRSWNSVGSGVEAITDEVRGIYITGGQRTLPATTTRIFLPPEASLDTVVRHGMLDRADSGKVLRGALRDVSFTPQRSGGQPQAGSASPARSGFPLAVTRKLDALDPDGAIYDRIVQDPSEATEAGIPVFEAGTNATTAPQIGYLPDPAAQYYCVRARIPGSQVYLEGAITIATETGSYPDICPLALVVVRVGPASAVRSEPAKNIGQIYRDEGYKWLDRRGQMHNSRASGRTRVRQVTVELYPGEEFELQVSCIPDPKMLAAQFSVPETIALQLDMAGTSGQLLDRIREFCGDKVEELCIASVPQDMTCLAGKPAPSMSAIEAVAQLLVDVMTTKWPVEELAAVRSLRACHAVNRPAAAPGWAPSIPLQAFHQNPAVACDAVIGFLGKNEERSTGLVLGGSVAVDLEHCSGFQVLADTSGANGRLLDDPTRGRSRLSRRSGRWPQGTDPDGKRHYVEPQTVYGFSVDDDGRVSLPRTEVSLLEVGGLPTHGAVGDVIPLTRKEEICVALPGTQPVAGVFAPSQGRLTEIALPPLFAAAASGAPITMAIAQAPDAVDIAAQTRQLRTTLPHQPGDELARRLVLRLAGIARQAPAFETAPAYFNGEEQVLHRRQPLKSIDQTVRGTDTREVWLPSTVRPKAPSMLRPELSFRITRDATPLNNGVSHSFTRRALIRLYMSRGWFSSGEGERLGIVLWPEAYHTLKGRDLDRDIVVVGDKRMHLDKFEDTHLGPSGSFVTRWGGDPVRQDKSPQGGFFIPPEAFRDMPRETSNGKAATALTSPIVGKGPHRPMFVPKVKMPVPGSGEKDQPVEYLQVSLMTYEPCFDLDREQWYVDVDLDPIRASEPFVRFGLVRYQEHAMSDTLAVSEPVTAVVQLLPVRAVEATEIAKADGGRSILVDVTGLGSVGIKDLGIETTEFGTAAERRQWASSFEQLALPKVKLALFHESQSGGTLIRRQVYPRPDAADGHGFIEIEPETPNTSLVWSASFDIAAAELADLGDGRLVVYVEEIDRRMPASYRNEPIGIADMFNPETFLDSGPRFIARIPLLNSREQAEMEDA